MSGIVLTASVRQNLFSLQSTASLLAKTQNNLATGNKVNTALDNPTNFFTAQGLNNRASDIANLLDGIGNGVQVLQAVNTGLTSLQALVASAQSIAHQVLQSPTGYNTKSNISSAVIPGATAQNLLGNNTNTFVAGSVSAGTNIGVGDTVAHLLSAIDAVTSTSVASTVSGGKITLNTGIVQNLTLAGSALAKLGLTAATTNVGQPQLAGETLSIAATGGGTPTNITFGTGPGQISTLNGLNAALAANNLQANISTTGVINIITSNDAASSTIGAIGGSATASGQAFNGVTAAPPVVDPNSQATRANLVSQYNNVLAQINTTSQDASFNGINLLNGDTLKLVFNETGRSTLNIQGVTFNDAGLGLATLTVGTDFLDSNSANNVLTTLDTASSTLRSEASALGSNLSIVQIRQGFSKNLINVLQTGASNLTLADTNEEAANSQALSTRQSIAVSALALANQSQASVLQLLR